MYLTVNFLKISLSILSLPFYYNLKLCFCATCSMPQESEPRWKTGPTLEALTESTTWQLSAINLSGTAKTSNRPGHAQILGHGAISKLMPSLAPQAGEAKAAWSELPQDVMRIVMASLSGDDIQTARLVCKDWNHCMSSTVSSLRPRFFTPPELLDK